MRGVDGPIAVHEDHQAERSVATRRQGEHSVQGLLGAGDGHPLLADGVVVLVHHPTARGHHDEHHCEQYPHDPAQSLRAIKHDTIVHTMNDTISREIPTRVLLESMVRPDGTIDAAELYSVANALDMSDQQVRLGIRRAIADGQLVQEGRGRRALLRATAAMNDALKPDVEFVGFAYDQDRGLAPWDGRWHVVAFAIPESSRPARDAMRAGIMRLGGAPIQGGLYVSPNAWEPHVGKVAADLDVSQHLSVMTTTDLRVGELTAAAEIAARLWPLDDIAERHHRLLNLAEKRLVRLRGRRELCRTEYLTIALGLAAEFTAAMEPDPLLPAELLPRAWIGARARAAFAQCWIRVGAMTDESVPRLFQRYADAVVS